MFMSAFTFTLFHLTVFVRFIPWQRLRLHATENVTKAVHIPTVLTRFSISCDRSKKQISRKELYQTVKSLSSNRLIAFTLLKSACPSFERLRANYRSERLYAGGEMRDDERH